MPTRWATVQHKEPDREEETCHPVDIKKTTILAKNRAVLACLSSTPTKRPFSAPLGLDDAESARARALEVSPSPETRGRRGDLEKSKKSSRFHGCPVPLARAQKATSKPIICANQSKNRFSQFPTFPLSKMMCPYQ